MVNQLLAEIAAENAVKERTCWYAKWRKTFVKAALAGAHVNRSARSSLARIMDLEDDLYEEYVPIMEAAISAAKEYL